MPRLYQVLIVAACLLVGVGVVYVTKPSIDAYFDQMSAKDAALVERLAKRERQHTDYMRGCVPTQSEKRCEELWRWQGQFQ
jgi:hypothetical protein